MHMTKKTMRQVDSLWHYYKFIHYQLSKKIKLYYVKWIGGSYYQPIQIALVGIIFKFGICNCNNYNFGIYYKINISK